MSDLANAGALTGAAVKDLCKKDVEVYICSK